ncbi:phosphoenolpyruvate--protein phosphotransferase [Anaeromyxobacter oryzae]|uniref:phosphoenolpyruvate--protein phosphotransferase n=1 Tax=Anaeromyxobacter oryzae TaxID=2918170 RepID=A0ABN6MV50_9BACT|nr:phosphoenolpyruvate--protein phosphotransferase [Anaeromyxobacter oryzae]BDG04775.1 phosphoenolpyruvate--protein phosphotransferase [Anaeromyxobacter oryzae]
MNLTMDLLHVVEQAHSLDRILEAATRVIAERLRVEGCFVFLLDEHGDLVRGAADGFHPSGRSQPPGAEAESIAAQVIAERRVATTRGETASLVASPMILRDRVVGALVLQSTIRRAFSVEDIGTLATTCAQLVGIVENARIIGALDRGERPAPRAAPRPSSAGTEGGERILRGVGASPGIAMGPAVFRGAYRLDLSARDLPAGEAAAERARVRTAIEKTHNDVSRIQVAAAREIDEEHALIFASHLMLLNDPTLLEHIDQQIARGLSAPLAIDVALEEFESRLRLVPDAYIRERIDDVDDLRSRLLDHVLGGGSRARFGAGIVLTSRIPPSLVVELKTEGAQALVTESGGATSHGVLLARAMAIPVVTGIADMLESVRPGDRLVVDGTSGAVVVRPSEDTLTRYEEERRRAERARTEHSRFRDVLARTADGERVTLHANVGVASDLTIARENGAEGIGLYRTEFPFIVRDSFPTRAEQVRIYGKAYEVFPAGPIHFRLLDLGGDKFVAGGHVATARGAFHGYRSIRVLFDHPDVLRDQVQALALAAADRPLRILIPMVTSIEELRRLRTLIGQAIADLDEPRAQRAPEIGVMIEVPAAVELAVDLSREADFLSIGTNDLMQYALVVDREDSRMAAFSDPYHPAILRMVARVAAAARAAGKRVGVCGEIAVRPDVALALMALGVDSLSVVPTAIPELKQALAGARLEPMRRAMGAILALSDARSVAAALRDAQLA